MGERADAPKEEEATALPSSDMAHNNNNNIVSPPLRQPYFLYPCPARGQQARALRVSAFELLDT